MNSQPKPSENGAIMLTKLEWGVVLSLLASAGSIIFSAGIIWTTVQQHDREILMLKAKADENTDRLARIETKLDIVISDQLKGTQ